MDEEEIIKRYISQKQSAYADRLWKKFPTIASRRERLASAHYVRQLRLYGKELADSWLKEKFPDSWEQMLESPSFKRLS